MNKATATASIPAITGGFAIGYIIGRLSSSPSPFLSMFANLLAWKPSYIPLSRHFLNEIEGDETMWINLGLWPATGPLPSFASACRSLSLHLFSLLNPPRTATLVDVGCGYGESLKLWKDEYGLDARGVNYARREVEGCRRRGLRCEEGNAVEGRHYENGCYVVAVDCCYHWGKDEWWEIMGKKGVKKVACSDFVVREGVGWGRRKGLEIACRGAGIERNNLVTRGEYLKMIESKGFRNVSILEIKTTLKGFREFCRKKMERCEDRGMRDEGYGAIMDDLLGKGEAIGSSGEWLEYVSVVAEHP